MKTSVRTSYEHTIYACYIGYITQAVVNNFAPLLFLTFQGQFGLTLDKITLLTTVNFSVQLCVDLISARIVDRIGWRVCVLAAHVLSAAGLIGLSIFPSAFPSAYAGLMLAVILYAIGGGLIEVLISPIVEACPTKKKEAAMSLLHSFYCWGHLGVVLLSTLFFRAAGIAQWRILALLWSLIPIVNIFYFSQVPIYPIVAEHEKMPLGTLLRQKTFWLLMALMVCAGASEQGMSQWASAFAESALAVSKTVGDLAGPCLFAFFMGMARALYGKYSDHLPLKRVMTGSAVLCIACYLLAVFARQPLMGLAGCAVCGFSVGIFWPGTFSIAALNLKAGGTALFALLALAGDVGCAGGPTVVGFVANASGGELKKGLLAAILFPAAMLVELRLLRGENGEETERRCEENIKGSI